MFEGKVQKSSQEEKSKRKGIAIGERRLEIREWIQEVKNGLTKKGSWWEESDPQKFCRKLLGIKDICF